MMTTEQAIRHLRADPGSAELVRLTYLDEDVPAAARRFAASAEFAEVRRLAAGAARGTVLDLGAGSGIVSWAFADAGAELVYALEPDPSDTIGRGAIDALCRGLPVRSIDALGERIPLPDASVDLVFARQVLHHIHGLPAALGEAARVLRPGGLFLACREHVVDGPEQLQEFLRNHAVHQLTGGENAYRLAEYAGAITGAGLTMERVLGPWDSVINAYPAVHTVDDLAHLGRYLARRRWGAMGALIARLPFAAAAIRRRVDKPTPGRLYSFLARKPAAVAPPAG